MSVSEREKGMSRTFTTYIGQPGDVGVRDGEVEARSRDEVLSGGEWALAGDSEGSQRAVIGVGDETAEEIGGVSAAADVVNAGDGDRDAKHKLAQHQGDGVT